MADSVFNEAAGREVELVVDGEHFGRVVVNGILKATTSVDIATADFKAMVVPTSGLASGSGRRGLSIVGWFRRLIDKGVEVRVMHSGVPSGPVLRELRMVPDGLTIRRCPRLHTKCVIIDCKSMYMGSANLTGAGLGAKGEGRRNFEMGVWTESTRLIDPVLEEFNMLWEGKRCDECKRKDFCVEPLEEPRL